MSDSAHISSYTVKRNTQLLEQEEKHVFDWRGDLNEYRKWDKKTIPTEKISLRWLLLIKQMH